ncbi:MAG: DNA translocase FtsK 4TM domain-containing protein, partial [Nitrospirota bacterium]|nr:DNA translocase FtsK 4TM domain-containing protein [Nitrospirota bacterium]
MEEKSSRIKSEITGLLAILAGIITVLSLFTHDPWDSSFAVQSPQLKNLLGIFGANLSEFLLQAVGNASYIFPVILFFYGIGKVFNKAPDRRWYIFAAAVIILTVSVSSFSTLALGKDSGGVLGIFTAELSKNIVSKTGSYLIFVTLMLVSLMYLLQFSVVALAVIIKSRIGAGSRALAAFREKRRMNDGDEDEAEVFEEELYESGALPVQEPLPLPPPEIKMKKQTRKAVKPSGARSGDYELPGFDLLNDPPPSKSKPTKDELMKRSVLLERKLLDYSIEGKVTFVSPGPIVTMFEFEPAPGVKISKVMSLADDLAMALKANSIRISPIHGKSTLGIEVPNKDTDEVFLKDIVSSEAFHSGSSKLVLALGKDIFGSPVMADLAKMPHLLIAGATGSGKSVGMNSIVLSILFQASPREVKMLMIDPKMLELSAYEDIPHLLMPVITLPKEASNALKKLVYEMERRYRLLADSGARNIDAYNKKVEAMAHNRSGGAAAG